MKLTSSVFLSFIVSLGLISCSERRTKELTNETVMNTGTIIKAQNSEGLITIEARQGLQRLYRWDNTSVNIKMIPRDRRWDGSLGIYNSGDGNKIHTVVEEGQQHFYSEQEAMEWLSWQNHRMHYVYSEDGLVVGWYKTKNSLSVQVWQFYILGNKPNKLPGARNDLVKIILKEGAWPQTKASNFQPNGPQRINGRLYSGKSVDMIKEKEISSNEIEKVLLQKNCQRQESYLYCFNSEDSGILWILLDNQGRIILLGR